MVYHDPMEVVDMNLGSTCSGGGGERAYKVGARSTVRHAVTKISAIIGSGDF